MNTKTTSSVFLDTHTLLWWCDDVSRLSKPAVRAIEVAKIWLVSTISFWEISLLVEKKRLKLSMSVEDWADNCAQIKRMNVVPIDHEIAVLAPQIQMHGDPADRFVVASSYLYQSPLITKDQKLRDLMSITTIW